MKKRIVDLMNCSMITKPMNLSSINFAFYGLKKIPKVKRRRATQITRWDVCRETVGSFVKDAWTPYGTMYKLEEICGNKTRILLLFANSSMTLIDILRRSKETIKRGTALVNLFEKEMGWGLSVPFIVPSGKLAERTLVYAVEGPKEWMRSPHLLSLYLLLIRSGRFEIFKDTRTIGSFLEKCKKVGKIYLTKDPKDMNKHFHGWPHAKWAADVHSLYDTSPLMLFFLTCRNKLYEGRDSKNLYGTADYSDGFRKLCLLKVADSKTRKRFKSLLENNKMEMGKTLYTLEDEIRKEAKQKRQKAIHEEGLRRIKILAKELKKRNKTK